MWFDHYRVPHVSLLAKYSSIKPGSGEYIKPPNSKLSYGTMVLIRASLVGSARIGLAKAATMAPDGPMFPTRAPFVGYARIGLAKAATIATRYSAIRRQFVDKDQPKKMG